MNVIGTENQQQSIHFGLNLFYHGKMRQPFSLCCYGLVNQVPLTLSGEQHV